MFAALGSLLIGLVGVGLNFYGQKQQAKIAQQQANYQADLARRQAEQENIIASENMRRKQREATRQLARARAMTAKQGLAMAGTPLAILGETASMLNRDIADMSFQAQQKNQELIHGANVTQWEGQVTAAAYKRNAYAGLISGGASLAKGFLTSTGRI